MHIDSEPQPRKRAASSYYADDDNDSDNINIERARRGLDGTRVLVPMTFVEREQRRLMRTHENLNALVLALEANAAQPRETQAAFAERERMRASPLPVATTTTTTLLPGRSWIQSLTLTAHPFLRVPADAALVQVYYDVDSGRFQIISIQHPGAAPSAYATSDNVERATVLATSAFRELVAPI
jgi:hypothetical protein